MTTIISGCYSGCPIKYLPTGYIVFLVKQGVMKKLWYDFYEELKIRLEQQSEPVLPYEILESAWFTGWTDESRERYSSMMTDGLFDWSGTTRKSKRGLKELNEVYTKLSEVYE